MTIQFKNDYSTPVFLQLQNFHVMRSIKKIAIWFLGCQCTCATLALYAQSPEATHIIHPVSLDKVSVDDPFWSPKLALWRKTTLYDVFDKLEGKYDPDSPTLKQDLKDDFRRSGHTYNAFDNFDRVAKGEKDNGHFDGLPWYDGLIYETIRAASDLLVQYPDKELERRIDAYIDRIAAAQAADKDGYLNTYTTLTRPSKRWGTNGGDDKWQHDVYNSGMLMEAAVHYYKATRKTKLLTVAVKQSNYICSQIGPLPKLNVIPGHGGPEEALLKLYQLFKADPSLKTRIDAPVKEDDYYAMVKFWIETRGYHGGHGLSERKSDSSYNQDHMPVLQQTTLEGHAVRGTLLATGVTSIALLEGNRDYIRTSTNYWNNIIGKRLFITGGQGAIPDGERFGPDYYLPEAAYLETCAAAGSGFFSEKMNELFADGKYMDEFERSLYNNILSGVSLHGDSYLYETPLAGDDLSRWSWHSCPCCPPMFLKVIAALPGYIYAQDDDAVYVNLFISGKAQLSVQNHNVSISQQAGLPSQIKDKTVAKGDRPAGYPWNGRCIINIDPEHAAQFAVNVRIPGWARGSENPFDLYHTSTTRRFTITVNGKPADFRLEKGYAVINRKWTKGDKIALELPVEPRIVIPSEKIADLRGKIAISAGPVVYATEGLGKSGLNKFMIDTTAPIKILATGRTGLYNKVTIVSGHPQAGNKADFLLVPFFTIADNQKASYAVWLPTEQKTTVTAQQQVAE